MAGGSGAGGGGCGSIKDSSATDKKLCRGGGDGRIDVVFDKYFKVKTNFQDGDCYTGNEVMEYEHLTIANGEYGNEVPKFEVPKFEVPKFEVPKFEVKMNGVLVESLVVIEDNIYKLQLVYPPVCFGIYDVTFANLKIKITVISSLCILELSERKVTVSSCCGRAFLSMNGKVYRMKHLKENIYCYVGED